VTDVLLDARDALMRAGSAPRGASRVLAGFARHAQRTSAKTRRLAAEHPRTSAAATESLLIGCAYVRGAPGEARHAIDATTALLERPVALLEECCGLPLRLAGDREAFVRHARAFARSVEGRERVVVVDAGCAFALRRRYPEAGVKIGPRVETFVELAALQAGFLGPRQAEGPVRWHDPCQLGRGLGVYEAPRAVLARVLGRAPDEFLDAREGALCAGAGGLLPSTMPEVAADIARARVSELPRERGGRVVTGCASSLRALRRAAVGSDVVVEDIVSVVAGAVG
jgi:Fe-S oxidoreductase